MPFEDLLETFEQHPFNEAHSSSSLGNTIVIYKHPSNNDPTASDKPNLLDEPTSTDSSPSATDTLSQSTLSPNLFGQTSGLKFNYSVSGYAYHSSKHPPRKTVLDSLPQSLIDPKTHTYALWDSQTLEAAHHSPSQVSIHRGDHSPGDTHLEDGYTDGEYPLANDISDQASQSSTGSKCVYGIPVEAYDRIEMKDVISLGCGEDSVVASSQILALADGVSGWNSRVHGHAALWSRLFVNNTLANFAKLSNSSPSTQPKNPISVAIDKAFLTTRTILNEINESGSSTLVAAALDMSSHSAHFVSVGDSCVWVFRDREVIFTIEHGAKKECPKQIGTHSESVPKDIETPVSLEVQPGDVVLMCSDGVADNLFIGEITEQLFEAYDKGGVQAAADSLVALAVDRSFDNFAVCPYQLSASSFSSGGGKSDDISVVVAEIVNNV